MARLNRDTVCAIVILLAGGVFFWATFHIPDMQYESLGSEVWPRFILVLLFLLLSAAAFITAFLSLLAGRLFAFLVLRLFLTVEEIRLYLDTISTWCDRRKSAKGLCHLYLAIVRRVLSLLYGQDLRSPRPAASGGIDLRQ